MNTPPLYVDHAGTVRISGFTDCTRAARCALHFALESREPIDFLFLGANAAQQAIKAMSCFSELLREATDGKTTVLYEPLHVMVETNPSGPSSLKDATFFRAIITKK